MSTVALIDNFVDKLVEHCEKEKISWAELARRSEVHVVTISRIVHKHLMPSVDTCEKLASGAGLDVDWEFSPTPRKSA